MPYRKTRPSEAHSTATRSNPPRERHLRTSPNTQLSPHGQIQPKTQTLKTDPQIPEHSATPRRPRAVAPAPGPRPPTQRNPRTRPRKPTSLASAASPHPVPQSFSQPRLCHLRTMRTRSLATNQGCNARTSVSHDRSSSRTTDVGRPPNWDEEIEVRPRLALANRSLPPPGMSPNILFCRRPRSIRPR